MDASLTSLIASRLDASPGDLEVQSWRDGRIVCGVRTAKGDVVAKASSVTGVFDEEAVAMRRLKGIGLPVSDIVMVESGPPALLVATWAHGAPISATSDPTTLRTVGSILQRIHQVPATPPFSGVATLQEWIWGWFNTVMAWWLAVEERAAGVESSCIRWMQSIGLVLADRPGSQMLFDGRPEHFIVDHAGNIRLIDVADLQAGDPAMDLAVLELGAPGILPHVLEGYAPSNGESRAFALLVPFYVFLRALSAAEWQSRMLNDQAGSRRHLDTAFTAVSGRQRLSP